MTTTVTLWLPVSPTLFGIFLGCLVFYLLYVAAKFVISIWTGA